MTILTIVLPEDDTLRPLCVLMFGFGHHHHHHSCGHNNASSRGLAGTNGSSALRLIMMVTCVQGDIAKVEELLTSDADINARGAREISALRVPMSPHCVYTFGVWRRFCLLGEGTALYAAAYDACGCQGVGLRVFVPLFCPVCLCPILKRMQTRRAARLFTLLRTEETRAAPGQFVMKWHLQPSLLLSFGDRWGAWNLNSTRFPRKAEGGGVFRLSSHPSIHIHPSSIHPQCLSLPSDSLLLESPQTLLLSSHSSPPHQEAVWFRYLLQKLGRWITWCSARTMAIRDLADEPLPLRLLFRSEMIALLVGHGAALNAVDVDGATPLHYAVLCGNEEVCKQLLDLGADPSVEDSSGATAQQQAPEGWGCW